MSHVMSSRGGAAPADKPQTGHAPDGAGSVLAEHGLGATLSHRDAGVWMRLLCVLAGIALAFAARPAVAEEEGAEAGAEETGPGVEEAGTEVTEPEPEAKPKLSRREEARRKRDEANKKAREDKLRRAQEARDRDAAARKKRADDAKARKQRKVMARQRAAEEARKKKEAARAAKERGARGEKEELAARPARSQEEIEREARIKKAGVTLPPDMPLTYIWSLPLKKEVTAGEALVRKDVVLLIVDRTVLYCIRKSDGVPVWAIDLGGQPQYEPVVSDRMVYVFVRNRLIGIDRSRGEIIWRISPTFAPAAAPCVNEPTLYIPAWDKRVYAVQVKSRERVFFKTGRGEDTLKATEYDFRYNWRKTAKGHIMGTPVLADGLIYFGSEDGYLYSVSVDGESRYRSQTQGPIRAPVRTGGASVYVGSSDFNAYAFDRLTGMIRWLFPTGNYVLQPIYADVPSGVAIVTSHKNGIFGVFDRATADRGKKLWHLMDGDYIAGVSRDLVYLVLTDHRLAAVEKKSGMVKWISLLDGVSEVVGNMNDWTVSGDKFRLICLTQSGHLVCLKEPKEELRRAIQAKK